MAALLAKKLALLGGGVLVVLLVAGLPSLGQGVTDPSGELDDAECYGHHKQEGFRSMDLFPEVLKEVPKGQEFEFKLTIRNPWLHELQDLYGYVNISGAPGLKFPGEKEPGVFPFEGSLAAQAGAYASIDHPIPVETNATELVLLLAGTPTGLPPQLEQRFQANDFRVAVTSPDGSIVLGNPPAADAGAAPQSGNLLSEIRVDQQNLTKGGIGDWRATVYYRGASPEGAYSLDTTVYYNLSKSTQLLMPGPALLKSNEAYTFSFTILAEDVEALQSMRYGGIGVAYHEHTDKNIGDVGNYDKWNTLQFETGSELRVGSTEIPGGIDTLGPIFRRWGQVLGFTGSFLIIPSLAFGGTFGKTSVVWANKLFGGPRRRVLFHNSMSFWLLGVSVLHMFLFFYEAFWNWSHGLVWGGLALACMIGLGVTGATQRAFVARWGFNRWRFVHFAMGVLVVVFVLVHLVADGSHFAPIREAFFGGSAGTLNGISK